VDGAPSYHERRIAAEARYAHDLSTPLRLEVHAGLLRNDDEIGGKQYDGMSFSAGVDLRYRVSGHNLIFTTGYTHAHIATASLALPPVFDARIKGVNRHHASVALQDHWEATPRLTVTAGARVDDFSDIGTRFTPRLALVYKLDDKQILKTQLRRGLPLADVLRAVLDGRAEPASRWRRSARPSSATSGGPAATSRASRCSSRTSARCCSRPRRRACRSRTP
jgi:hypothetical protein